MKTIKNASRHRQLAELRSHTRTGRANRLLKTADLGGTADNSFEQAFANLAHTLLRDKAPKLLDYEVGFQLLEKSEDNTKAVGVFGFQLGHQWLYVPSFFLNGDMKGHELLYVKKTDLFMPLKDSWVNYLLGSRPASLGTEVDRNLPNQGVLSPDLYRLARSPYKWASTQHRIEKWAHDALPMLGYLATTPAASLQKYEKLPTFLDTVAELGHYGRVFLTKVAEAYPGVAQAIQRLYSPQDREKAANRMAVVERQQRAPDFLERRVGMPPSAVAGLLGKVATVAPPSPVQIVTRAELLRSPNGVLNQSLSEAERNQVLRDGQLIKDARKSTALVYSTQTQLKLFTPSEAGLYDVLIKPDKFEKCFVSAAPLGGSGTMSFCTVVSLEGKNWLNTHPSQIFCRSRYSAGDYQKWLDSLPAADSAPVAANAPEDMSGADSLLIFVGPTGATTPLRLDKGYVDAGDVTPLYHATFFDHPDRARAFYHSDDLEIRNRHVTTRQPCVEYIRLVNTGITKLKLSADGDTISVPKTFKKLTLAPSARPSPYSGDHSPICAEFTHSSKLPLQPGSLEDVNTALSRGMKNLKLDAAGADLIVSGKRMSKGAALHHLILDWDLSVPTANHLIEKMASTLSAAYWVKEAANLSTGEGPGAPSFPTIATSTYGGSYVNVPVQPAQEYGVQSPGMAASLAGNLEKYMPLPDPQTMGAAQQAAQTGQKDVFDTAMLGSLLRTLRQDNMVDRYLPDLIKGMDRLGRILFQFYWHGEEFGERYGDQDLPEMEDGLRNAFEAVGDIVLFLKRRTTANFGQEGIDVDLAPLANQ